MPTRTVGVLTAGGDAPGLNAAIRAIGKAARHRHGMTLIGFKDGFAGAVHNRFETLEGERMSGLLAQGGTILGTGRDKPHKMQVGGKQLDMTASVVENYEKHQLEALIILGGGGTQRNAARLAAAGLNIVTIPKTIDNDIWGTDVALGFDTALGVASSSIDRLHSTAHSHHRIMLVETMGHNSGWLALGSGIAGGADVILLPEIPYSPAVVGEAILRRKREGKTFSIVTVAEGAISHQMMCEVTELREELKSVTGTSRKNIKAELKRHKNRKGTITVALAEQLEELTGLSARVTILGHVQRGGTPSATDRLLTSRLGVAAVDLIDAKVSGVMIAVKGRSLEPIALDEVAGKRRRVYDAHSWIHTARSLGICLGELQTQQPSPE